MFLIDDLLLFPFRSLAFIFKQVHKAAQKELESEAQASRTRLSELYMMLETGRITEEEFDKEEKKLLDRLEQLESGLPQEERAEETEASPHGQNR